MVENNLEENKSSKTPRIFLVVNIFFAICFICIFIYYFCLSPLESKNTTIHIAPNQNLSSVISELKIRKVIKNEFVLKTFVYILKSDKDIDRGDYLFKKGVNVFHVAWQLAFGKHDVDKIKVTFPEGYTKIQMADLLAEKMSSFRRDIFLNNEKSKEGYLFPDTYFLYPLTTTYEVLDEMTNNFNKKISSLDKQIKNSRKNLNDIIIMASLIQKEANGKEDASMISGILWKRLSIGMPLQVDADRFTYKNKGLPEHPINNPGMVSIEASINPEDSLYLYYIHDKNGKVYFAKDYLEHKKNINNYLK